MSKPEAMVVGILEARDVLAMDLNGFSDPFVVVSLLDAAGHVVPGTDVLKTSIQKKTLTPTWNERFVVGDGDLDLRVATTLRFLVCDYDGLKTNDLLGVVDVPIDTLLARDLAAEPIDEWMRISKFEGMIKDATGELHVTFARAPKPEKKSKEEGTPNILYVTIESGRDLLAMDSGNTSDPFVKLSIVGQTFHTATIAKTLKPHWDEKFAFLLRDLHNTIDVVAEDEDRTINDFLGRAQVVLADLGLQPNVEQHVDVQLLNKKLIADKYRGTLHLRLLWTHDADAESITASVKKHHHHHAHSLATHFKTKLGMTAPDAQEDAARLEDEMDVLQDESDEEDTLPLPPEDSWLQFAVITVHRAEELPPLDALVFEKESHKTVIPGGGIDAYVAAWITGRPEEHVRTRIHTRKGRQSVLSTGFHESLMVPLPDGIPAATSVTLAIMDWDHVGGDDCVSHLVLHDYQALAQQKQGKPFWWNLYGAPLVGCKDKNAFDAMNEDTTAGSIYRGRVLLSLKLQKKRASAYENKLQKRAAKKLPRSLFPESRLYRLRAHFASATGLPTPNAKYFVTLSCGLQEISSSRKAAAQNAIEWNETEESDRILMPIDIAQIPDVMVCLYTGEWNKRVIVSYKRFPASMFLPKAFGKDNVAPEPVWISLLPEPTTQVVSPGSSAGQVLVRASFGTLEEANEQNWDQRKMLEEIRLRAPYQVRVRIHGVKHDGAAPSSGWSVSMQCWDQVTEKNSLLLPAGDAATAESKPSVLAVDVNVPSKAIAPPVIVHVKDPARPTAILGSVVVPLTNAEESTKEMTTLSSSRTIKVDPHLAVPTPQWCAVQTSDGSATSTELLLSVQLIRKAFPDEVLPTA